MTDGSLTSCLACAPPPSKKAPEQWDARYGPPGPATDVWAFGCLLCDLGTGVPAWKGLPQEQIMTRVINDKAAPALPPPSAPALRRAAEMCLKHDPAARPSIAEVRRPSLCGVGHEVHEYKPSPRFSWPFLFVMYLRAISSYLSIAWP